MEYIAISENVVYAIHGKLIAESGDDEGIRDAKLLQSALSAPQNLLAYDNPDIADLAACYGYRITNNHAFIDGNKRTGFVIMVLFLNRNGSTFTANEDDSYKIMIQVSTKAITEQQFAEWIRNNIA